MKTIAAKIAAVLAFAIGAMAVVAGASVLLGRTPSYNVIGWLPAYNLAAGVAALAAAILIWKSSRFAAPVAWATLAAHSLVMLILLLAYRDAVAPASLVAMAIRLVTWSIIVALLWVQARSTAANTPEQSHAPGL